MGRGKILALEAGDRQRLDALARAAGEGELEGNVEGVGHVRCSRSIRGIGCSKGALSIAPDGGAGF
ncbi:hypothetical protein D3C78_1909770 [compost metagenome]